MKPDGIHVGDEGWQAIFDLLLNSGARYFGRDFILTDLHEPLAEKWWRQLEKKGWTTSRGETAVKHGVHLVYSRTLKALSVVFPKEAHQA